MFLDAPRGFRDPARLAERRELLAAAEDTLPLEAWARDVEERRRTRQPEIVVPHFDPAETGVRSQVLLLLEAPGPKTVPEWGGSGFISVDNDDPTAQNLWRTRDEVAQAAKEFAVFYQKGKVNSAGGYLVNHSTQAYLMGRQGQPIALVPIEDGPKAVTASLEKWVS